MENSLIERLEEIVEKNQQSAGSMLAAANRLHTAVSTMDSSLTAFMSFMDNWITRLEAVQKAGLEDKLNAAGF